MTRTLFAALLVAAAPLAAAADDPKKPDYFPLAKGHKWEYAAQAGDNKVDITITVTAVKTEKGKVTATRVVTEPNRDTTEEITVTAAGVSGHLFPGIPAEHRATLLKYPVKPRDTWTEKFQIKEKDLVALSTVKEPEEVKVPAGTFKAVPVETGVLIGEGEESFGLTTWYADGTGVVKQKVVLGNNALTVTLQLKKFTPGKGD